MGIVGEEGVRTIDLNEQATDLLGSHSPKLARLKALLDKLGGSVTSTLTSSQINVLEVTHRVQACGCNTA